MPSKVARLFVQVTLVTTAADLYASIGDAWPSCSCCCRAGMPSCQFRTGNGHDLIVLRRGFLRWIVCVSSCQSRVVTAGTAGLLLPHIKSRITWSRECFLEPMCKGECALKPQAFSTSVESTRVCSVSHVKCAIDLISSRPISILRLFARSCDIFQHRCLVLPGLSKSQRHVTSWEQITDKGANLLHVGRMIGKTYK